MYPNNYMLVPTINFLLKLKSNKFKSKAIETSRLISNFVVVNL